MWNLTRVWLAGIAGMSGLLILAPAVYSATYQCEQNGVIVYSDTRCGPNAQQRGEVQNLYPGGLRAGEQQMLNESTEHKSAPVASDGTGGYGDRLRERNEQRRIEGEKRRIPSAATSPWR